MAATDAGPEPVAVSDPGASAFFSVGAPWRAGLGCSEMADSREDIYGRRARIGYTSPPLTTEVFPYEFYQMVPAGVTLVITTLAIVVRSKGEVDQSYDISMKATREMAAAGVDIVVLGGVPINLSKGAANAEQMVADLEAELKVKVSTSASAQARAARALGCKKVIVAQP